LIALREEAALKSESKRARKKVRVSTSHSHTTYFIPKNNYNIPSH